MVGFSTATAMRVLLFGFGLSRHPLGLASGRRDARSRARLVDSGRRSSGRPCAGRARCRRAPAPIASLTSSSRRSTRSMRVRPRRCSSKTSSRSWWVPTIEPFTVRPPSTVWKIGRRISFSAGRPTQTSVPPRASEPSACSKADGVTAVEIAWSAPPSAWIAATGSSSPACTTCSAPSSRAVSSRSSLMSTATTAAPVMRAYWIARWPRPPAPNTATSPAELAPETFTAL